MKTIYEKLTGCVSSGEVKRMLEGNGLVVVPREPTDEMKGLYDAHIWIIEPERFKPQCAARIYRAMINAALGGE